jgi:tRNA threonylcarbamoyladenosine biosynthesis protein TsaE
VRLSADDLSQFGERLGRELRRDATPSGPPPPLVIGLSGELGAGKTTLVQAVCRGLGAQAAVTSPTYALVHRYAAPAGPPIYHVDCYRLRTPDEARDLGFDDMLREGAIVLIEWPERAGAWAPPIDRRFRLSHDADPDVRQVVEV